MPTWLSSMLGCLMPCWTCHSAVKRETLEEKAASGRILIAVTLCILSLSCFVSQVVSLRDVSAAEAAMVYTLEPLYGAGFAWLLLGERWGPMGWVGAALILGKLRRACDGCMREENAWPWKVLPFA